ncbi:MAG: tetratricopeptide repeat protein [Acidobacteria bacterium]|nr:tetratricopeptide repeat protein [Acidobacteriota bacterium]
MRGRFFCFFTLALAVVFPVLQTSAQGIGDRNRPAEGDGRYSIQGRVYLPNGKPAINARVSISSAENSGISAVTDMNGMFQVGGLRAGNYTCMVSFAGFPAEKEILTIDRFAPVGRTFSVTIHLQPEPRSSVESADDSRLSGVPKLAQEKYRNGLERLKQNDAKGAIMLFNDAIALHPNFAAAYYEKGSAHLKENDLDKALESFVKAVSIDQNYLEAKYSVGYTQYLKKNYEVAAAIFVDVLKQKRDLAEAYMYLGISLYYLKNIRDAETALKAAVAGREDIRVALAHRFLGGLYAQTNRNPEAAAELQKYLELVPTAPDATRLRSTIEELKKKS